MVPILGVLIPLLLLQLVLELLSLKQLVGHILLRGEFLILSSLMGLMREFKPQELFILKYL